MKDAETAFLQQTILVIHSPSVTLRSRTCAGMMGKLAGLKLANTAGAEGLVSCLDGGLLHQAQNAPNILDVAGKPVLPSKGAASRGLGTFTPVAAGQKQR